jgi:hypothetical protein
MCQPCDLLGRVVRGIRLFIGNRVPRLLGSLRATYQQTGPWVIESAMEAVRMIEHYGKGTHTPCKECGRKIFTTGAELFVRDGNRLVELKCSEPGCVLYDKPTLYDENELDIRAQRQPDSWPAESRRAGAC